MKEKLRRLTLPVLFAMALLAVATPVSPAADDDPEPFPCEIVCVPSPVFPFLICAPTCPNSPGPGL